MRDIWECEFLNPGGSVKDRPALQIIKISKKKIEKEVLLLKEQQKYWN